MRIKMAVAAAFLVLVLVGVFVLQKIKASDEEAPIVVKNGSIDIETQDGEWNDGGADWINQTSGKINGGELWVKVTSSTGTCRAQGKPVQIQYSQPGVQVTLTTSGAWWFAKTRVAPKSAIAFVDVKHLRAGAAGDGGHITEVRTQSLTCTLSPTSTNVEINICSSAKVSACQ
jgi:hypothetical protein